jgi:high-affinity nickel-transport protein
VGELNGNFGVLGFGLIGLLLLSWVVSVAVYKWRRLDALSPEEL